MRTHHEPRRRGLTLVEVTVALTLLVTGVLSVLSAHVALSRATARARSTTRIALLATSTFDSLRATECAALRGGVDRHALATLSWRVSITNGTASVDMVVSPPFGVPWQLESVLPC